MARVKPRPAKKKASAKKAKPKAPPTWRGPASRPWTDAEIDAIEAAWGDASRLTKLGTAVGLELTTAALGQIERARRGLERRTVLLAIADAMASEHGIGVREVQAFMRASVCVAAAGPRGLAVAIRHADNKGTGVGDLWPALRPWFRELGKNRARVDAWLEERDDERIEMAITGQAPAEVPADETSALIAAIVAAPDDDTPRLVLADLLQQRGDPHGELITLMCQQGPAKEQVSERIAQLLEDHQARVAGEVAQRAKSFRIARGFVESVTMNVGSFAAHGERLFGTHPIRELCIKPVNDEVLAKLARTPALARVRKLNLEQEIGRERDVPVGPLLASRYFTRLEHLRFSHWHARDWKAACAKLDAPALRELEIYAGNFYVGALIPLLESPKVPRLARIDLTGGMFSDRLTRPTAKEADALSAAIAAQTKLEVLALDNDSCGLGPQHWRQIFASPGGRALEALVWNDDSFDDADLEAITGQLPCALRSLDLARSGVHAEAIVRFLKSPAGARVERLVSWSSDAAPLELAKGLRTLPADHPLVYVGIGEVELADRFVDANVTDHPERARRGWG